MMNQNIDHHLAQKKIMETTVEFKEASITATRDAVDEYLKEAFQKIKEILNKQPIAPPIANHFENQSISSSSEVFLTVNIPYQSPYSNDIKELVNNLDTYRNDILSRVVKFLDLHTTSDRNTISEVKHR
jgi:hypothetical protein